MSGTLFCALVDKTETTFGVEHQRKDLTIVGFVLDHSENSFASVKIIVQNQRGGGLLAPDRPRWAWFSEEISPGVFQPLFFGRCKGWPQDLSGETLTIEYDGKPADFNTQQAALAETLFTLPQVDPVMIDEKKILEPETVLVARSAFWHADRVTGEVTISDIIVGEDGLEVYANSEVPYDKVVISRGPTPLKSISVNASVRWKQTHAIDIDMGQILLNSYTGDGLIGDWPKPGSTVAGGYRVVSATAEDVNNVAGALTSNWSYHYQNGQKKHENGDTLSVSLSQQDPILKGKSLTCILVEKIQVGYANPFAEPPINIPATRTMNKITVPLWTVRLSMTLGVDTTRDYVERIQFTVPINLQELDTDSDDAVTTDTIEVDGNDVGTVMPDGSTDGSIPIVSTDRNSYFLQERGDKTIQHLALRARAKGLMSARCLTVSADIPWSRARDLSCRKNAQIPGARIPGGFAVGKVVAYQLRFDPQAGIMMGNVTIACCPGFGQALEAVPGTPEYVDEGVLDPGIQFYTNSSIIVAGTTDMAYSPPVQTPNDDGLILPLTRAQIVKSEVFTGSAAAQETAILAAFEVEKQVAALTSQPATSEALSIDLQQQITKASQNNLANTLKNNPVTYSLELVDLSDGFENLFTVEFEPLEAPRDIDLQATLASASALFVDPDTIFAPVVS